jgi:simple sugar transport system substrate-binding protein
VKYAGDWYLPADERAIAETLVDTYNCDVLTQQTDSSSTLDVAGEKNVWFVGKDMDIVGEYGWSDTDTVAVSFDTRWEVIYDQMIQEFMAGNMAPETVVYPGLETSMTLADGTVESTVDLMNDGKTGVDAISPAALPLIPQEIVDLVQQRREQMMNGEWDPFTEHEFVSNGTGLELSGLPIPAAGTVVKAAGVVPTVEFLLSQFNFDLQGTTILE